MAEQQIKINVEKAVAITGLVSSLVGVISTWTMLQHRIDELEKNSIAIEEELDQQKSEMVRMERDFNEQGRRIRCDICRAKGMECPGC